MDCPRCSEPDVAGPDCPACGVILAKARSRRSPSPGRSPKRAESPSRWPRPSAIALILVGGAVVFWAVRRSAPPDPPLSAPARPAAPDSSAGPAPAGSSAPVLERLPVPAPPAPLVPSVAPGLQTDTADAADRADAQRLAALVEGSHLVGEDDIRAAEALHARHGPPARNLLEAVLLKAAEQERAGRRYPEARSLLERAARLAPDSVHPQRALVGLALQTGDWAAAEGAARAALAHDPEDADSVRGLAYALVRLDQSRDAIELLEDFLERHEDAEMRALLQRVRGDVSPEADLTEQRLAHFHVRYDGEEHVLVGREVLRVLDRHYSTLVRAFDHRPGAPIPVILLSRESYAAATGAPGWSGGLYDSFDGRVRIPIAGLTAALTPEIDDTLLHELTHAFVADRSRGVAPREIQEGLAQLMEGKRVADLLGAAQLTALAEGRLRGVGGFYMAALSFVEHLHAQRGQGGINDLLEAMAETGSADAAYEQVYRRDGAGLQAEWQTRLKQQYGR